MFFFQRSLFLRPLLHYVPYFIRSFFPAFFPMFSFFLRCLSYVLFFSCVFSLCPLFFLRFLPMLSFLPTFFPYVPYFIHSSFPTFLISYVLFSYFFPCVPYLLRSFSLRSFLPTFLLRSLFFSKDNSRTTRGCLPGPDPDVTLPSGP